MHCQAGDTLLGHAPVWLSAVIFLLIGGIIGALSGVLGMLWRQKQLRRQTYLTADHVYDGASQPTGTSSAAQTIPYKHAWRSVPAASHSGYGTASPSSQQSAFLGQEYGRKPLSQRLLQEEAIRKSGVSGPLGIGVVMHSMKNEPMGLHGIPPALEADNSFGRHPSSLGGTPSKTPAKPNWEIAASVLEKSSSPAPSEHADAKENATSYAYSGKHDTTATDSAIRSPADTSYALRAIQANSHIGIGRPDAAPSGPAMMTSDNTYVELSNTPPLASASHHGSGGAAAPDTAAHDHFESSAVATSAANQYLRSAAALRVGSGLQAEQRAPVRAAPPPPPPPPALATSSGSDSPGASGTASAPSARPPRGPAPSTPASPAPRVLVAGAPPPPPPPPPAGGLPNMAKQISRAPAKPVAQGRTSSERQPSQPVGGGMASIAEQAAQMAAKRAKAQASPEAGLVQVSRQAKENEGGPRVTSSGNPFSAAAPSNRSVLTPTTHKHAPSEAYELEDLDEDWLALLSTLDTRLLEVGRPTMMAKERAVAVRSLLVSTATEKPDVALQKAIDDIERYRRIH